MKSTLLIHKKLYLIILLLIFSSAILKAQTIKGNITDAKNGETLIGATVHIEKGTYQQNTTVKLDGTYAFKNIPAGEYKLQVKYVGYKTTKEYTVEVKADEVAVLNVAMVDNSTALNEVSIVEHASKETDRSARNDERNATTTLNAVSAASIAISPDVLVSNVLSRVSGITIDRNNTGDAEHVIIRGMDKQYNTTLINGVKIPSPDNKNRYVPLNIFPADLIERIEVSKTLTSDMEADASGGVVNLIMKSAPTGLRIEGNFGTGYSQIFFNRPYASFDASTVNSRAPGEINPGQPATISQFPYQNLLTKTGNAPPNATASLTIGNRYLNNKLGVLFSGTYQNLYQGSNDFVVVQENTVGPSPNINTPNQETAFQSSYNRQYSSQLNRLGTMASIDYKFDDRNSINLFATYLQLDEHRVRQEQSLTYGGYSYQGYVGTNGIDDYTETRTDLQSIFNATLKGKHQITGPFSIDWTFANSEATHKQPDRAEFKTSYQTSPGPDGTNEPTPGSPGSSTYVAPSVVDGPVTVGNESREWTHNTDKDISGYLNFHYNIHIFDRKATFSVGAMLRHKTRDNFVDSYSLPNTYIPGTDNAENYTTIPAAQFSFSGANAYNAYGSSSTDPGVYTFLENIHAEYAMVQYFVSDRFDFTAGIRTEHTLESYVSNLPDIFPGQTASITYSDYLPSINAKYQLTDNQAIRGAYFESILRPAFADFIPYPDQTGDLPYATIGNPYLQHTTINNYDLRYEFFPGAFDEFMAGAFYKNLTNPIEQVLQSSEQGATLLLKPENLGNAQNYGAEFVAKKFFGNVGVAVNYTYTHSQITTTKGIDVEGVVGYRDETRPLQGQAANVGNFSLLYKNPANGLEGQLSLAYTGDRIEAVSNYYGLDTWEKASTFLDFSAQKTFNKRYVFFVKVNNILNTPYELYIKQNNSIDYASIMKYADQKSPNYTTVEYDQFYARYSLGFRFKF
ncbi:TonB-dependent receptor domain-containing protein [Mucilaginibacter sp. X4EP1]|uniref:TonB-dependent receptor n=1 Tax=Mucilaginibacter sp. X4EP1 TaxID=2723092 RepID=UPI00216710D1|nr:TonB-dependent receptor [Mucilaginibacter sp. X4EP1]MCS3814746.1 TonB-dependent receptor [Mucilaginibacter sp. X4EP1]